jgi:hypothetical protein
MNSCKDCKYFDNTKPVDTTHNDNDKYKTAEEYIGECKEINRIKMMNDSCCLFKSKE